MKYILLSAVIYGPGTLLFIIAKREQNKSIFTPIEKCLLQWLFSLPLWRYIALQLE